MTASSTPGTGAVLGPNLGKLESVPVQSTFMHGQGLMVQVMGGIHRREWGGRCPVPPTLASREERRQGNLSGAQDTR